VKVPFQSSIEEKNGLMEIKSQKEKHTIEKRETEKSNENLK